MLKTFYEPFKNKINFTFKGREFYYGMLYMLQAHLDDDECDPMRSKTIELARACLDEEGVHPLKYNLFTSNCELFSTLMIAFTLHFYKRDNANSAQISQTVASIYDTVVGPDNGSSSSCCQLSCLFCTERSRGLNARIQV